MHRYFYKLIEFLIVVIVIYSAPAAEVWREAEHFTTGNWPETFRMLQPDGSGASNHRVLRIYTKHAPADGVYRVNYELEIPESGNYRLWFAMSPPKAGWASPVKMEIDGKTTDFADRTWTVGGYGGKRPDNVLGWIDGGTLKLSKGKHNIAFLVDKPRNDGMYICFFDGFLLTTDRSLKPSARYRISKQQKGWPQILKEHGSFENLKRDLDIEDVEALRAARQNVPELWREAENPDRSNWPDKLSIIQPDGTGASGHKVLRIYTKRPPENGVFRAEYDLNIPADGKYTLWLAISPTNAGWASPVKVELDGRMALDLSNRKRVSPGYGEYLGWTNGGKLELTHGRHTLTFLVNQPRKDGMYICFFDGFLLTTADDIRPRGNYYLSPKQKSWPELLKEYGSYEKLQTAIRKEEFFEKMKNIPHREGYSESSSAKVLDKIMARPLPAKENPLRLHRIGIHGMERPFVRVKSAKRAKYDRAFELLARAGVDSLRTAESCWHRLGAEPESFNYADIDYQVEMGSRYGMNFLFTIGYPSGKYALGGSHLSTFQPKYEGMFRDYLRRVITRYDKYAQYWEYCNEVDAPHVWWRGGATIADYVRDCRIVREELEKAGSKVPLLGISATYSRDASRNGNNNSGQAFSRKCAELGIADYVDGYSLHYTWQLRQKGFVEFFRNLTPDAPASRRLVNSEEAGYSHPGDVIKVFARDLYLYGFESVYYYIAQDWIEVGNVIYSGLFDLDWNPKLRLASLAVAADAMKTRNLVSMAEPAPGVEAYLLEEPENGLSPRYAVVLWRTGGTEEIGNRYRSNQTVDPVTVKFPAKTVLKAIDWKLDEIVFPTAAPEFTVSGEPLVVYCSELPPWRRITPVEWLDTHDGIKPAAQALLPGQN